MLDAVTDEGLRVVPYVLSVRARLRPDTTRLRYPAALALRGWSRFDHPDPTRTLSRRASIDLVHGTNYVVPPSRLPRLVSVYDCWALENPGAVHRDVRLMMGALGRAIATGAHVHTSSHATEVRLRGFFPEVQATTVHLGAPDVPVAGSWPAVVPDDGPIVLALGTIERRKNLPFLVSAMSDVIGMVPAARLVIAGGGGDDRSALESAIGNLPSRVGDRVHVIGRVSDEDAVGLLRGAAVVAYPSLDEGFGFPVLEAMGADVPVVASKVGSLPEIAGDAALLFHPDDRAGWSEALVSALTDHDLRRRLIDAGRVRLAVFSWTSTGRRLVGLYDDLVENRVRRGE